MITDPCDCGVEPKSHAHIVNEGKDKILFWKGAPILEDKDGV